MTTLTAVILYITSKTKLAEMTQGSCSALLSTNITYYPKYNANFCSHGIRALPSDCLM